MSKHKKKKDLVVLPESQHKRDKWILEHEDAFKPFLPLSFFPAFRIRRGHTPPPKIKVAELPALQKQPACINGTLKDYQLKGVNFFINLYNNGLNGILGDEMGLGKTLQTISFLGYLKERKTKGSHLVVCPLSVLSTWMSEIKKFCPSLKAICFHGIKEERDRLKTSVMARGEFDICVTTYEMLVAEDYFFASRFMWKYLVLDEGHIVRHEETQISKVAKRVHAHHRIILTGTPVHNNLHELWALFHFLMPDVFTEATAEITGTGMTEERTWITEKLSQAHKLLTLLMLRRLKTDVELNLPTLEEIKLYVPLSPMQRFWYKRILTREASLLNSIIGNNNNNNNNNNNTNTTTTTTTTSNEETKTVPVVIVDDDGTTEVKIEKVKQEKKEETEYAVKGDDWKRMNSMFMQLRKVCCHPFMFPNSEPEPFINNENLIKSCAKFEILDKLLAEIQSKGGRVLIYSQFTTMLDILEDYCNFRGHIYTRLDGSTNRSSRNLNVRLYNSQDSDIFIFLISTKAGGLGLNLATANNVIIYDSDFNPQNDLQAQARAHRIGQTRDVTVYRLVTQDTIEEYVVAIAEKKLYLSAVVAEGGQTEDSENSHLIQKAIKFGASVICNPPEDYDAFLKMDVKAIVDRSIAHGGIVTNSEYSTSNFNEILSKAPVIDYKVMEDVRPVKSNSDSDRTMKSNSDRERPMKSNSDSDICTEWKDLVRRSRTDRIVMIDGYPVLRDTIVDETVPDKSKEEKKRKRIIVSGHESNCLICKQEITKEEQQKEQKKQKNEKKDKKKKQKKEKKEKISNCSFLECSRCPRAYHTACLEKGKTNYTYNIGMLICPQHKCDMCARSTTASGGLLFTCCYCPSSFCEECLPSDVKDIGFVNEELEKYDYLNRAHVFYIQCDLCFNPKKKRDITNAVTRVTCGVTIGSYVAVRPDPTYGDDFWLAKVTDASKDTLFIYWFEKKGKGKAKGKGKGKGKNQAYELWTQHDKVSRKTVLKYDVQLSYDKLSEEYHLEENILD